MLPRWWKSGDCLLAARQVQQQLEARLPELQAQAAQQKQAHQLARQRSRWWVQCTCRSCCAVCARFEPVNPPGKLYHNASLSYGRYGPGRPRLPGPFGSAPHLNGEEAGDVGFDPLGLAKDPATFARLVRLDRLFTAL